MINKTKILITGGAGYIGSMLCTELVKRKYEVTVIDKLNYNSSALSHLYIEKNFTFIKADILNKKIFKKFLKNNDIIIPLAALVGAPLCEKNKKLAKVTNYNSIKYLVENISKKKKIIYPTTNSGYGIGRKGKFCDENSELNPISLYGKTKVDAEKKILERANSISFRLATVFGVSYRMRSDLLVNNFVKRAVEDRKIHLFEPNFRRNYIHIKDVVRAFIFAIEKFNILKGNSYNLGLSEANLTKLQLTKKIKKKIKDLKIIINNNRKDPDKRDYFVSNKKIEKKGFKAKYTLAEGINELEKYFNHNKEKIKNNY